VIDFTDWLRNNMLSHSGIHRQQLRGSQRKRVLTCVQTGVVACQVVQSTKFDQLHQATTRVCAIAPTNVVQLHRKPR